MKAFSLASKQYCQQSKQDGSSGHRAVKVNPASGMLNAEVQEMHKAPRPPHVSPNCLTTTPEINSHARSNTKQSRIVAVAGAHKKWSAEGQRCVKLRVSCLTELSQ